ncbi:MAG TPA: DUF547 domain-containing protein [Candidatus Eisenbacteria bacterium]|nr:DUF547 domain-containing protein [Candidatus Eisenbacteria bacterium]
MRVDRILIASLIVLLLGAREGEAQGPNPILLETPCAPAGYERLLRDYLVEIQEEGGAVSTRFDYARFHASPNQRAFREDLRTRFLSANPETMDPPTRHAWAVNAYNFLVIDLVVEHFVAPGKDTLRSVRDLGPEPFALFEEARYTVGSRTYSLNTFERHFVFDEKEDVAVDPRYHFVLVCAAKGCPPLPKCPLAPETLDLTLDHAVRNALRSPNHLRLENKTLHVSKIFEWYARDFKERHPRAFLSRYAPEDVRLALSRKNGVKELKPDIEWNWDLNRP